MTTATEPKTPEAEDKKTWYQKQQEIHGKEKFPDDPALTGPDPDDLLRQGETTLEKVSAFLGAGRLYTVGGLNFLVKEPTIRQIKKFLLPAAQKMTGANVEDILENMKALDEFQALMLDCLEFADGDAPEDRLDWSDNLSATEGIKLLNAFADGIDWAEIMNQATALQGKIQGVRVRASRK